MKEDDKITIWFFMILLLVLAIIAVGIRMVNIHHRIEHGVVTKVWVEIDRRDFHRVLQVKVKGVNRRGKEITNSYFMTKQQWDTVHVGNIISTKGLFSDDPLAQHSNSSSGYRIYYSPRVIH